MELVGVPFQGEVLYELPFDSKEQERPVVCDRCNFKIDGVGAVNWSAAVPRCP